MGRMSLAAVGLGLVANGWAVAQSTYKLPPPGVVKILDAPPSPGIVVSPGRDAFLIVEIEGYPPIRELARPILRLAGVRVDPGLVARQRTTRHTGVEVVPLDGRPRKRVELPAGSRIGMPSWSPGGTWFAFTRDLPDGVELWVVDAGEGQGRAIPEVRVVDVLGRGFEWEDDGHLLVHRATIGRRPAPAAPEAPSGPNIEEASGKVAQVATYQDLLKSPGDEESFRYYVNEPILLIHGEADNNSGTFPIQSERLFQAIQGSGGTARLVLLPHESHGYRARESVLHVLAEMFDRADKHIKDRATPAPRRDPAGARGSHPGG